MSKKLKQIAEETVLVFIGVFLAGATALDANTVKAAASAGVLAAIVALKGAIAGQFGDKTSASFTA